MEQLAINTLFATSDTNLPQDLTAEVVHNFIQNAGSVTVRSGTGPYYGYQMDNVTTPNWYAVRDEATWREVVRVMEEGGDLTAVVPLPYVGPA